MRLAIFASGSGSNAVQIIKHFSSHPEISVGAVFCNRSQAAVIEKAEALGIDTMVFTKADLTDGKVLESLIEMNIDGIVLAGFLLLIPQNLLKHYGGRIINIHPSLLPKYGGKGMYGQRVHENVLNHGEKTSGITIHVVDKEYDKGELLFQKVIVLSSHETIDSLSHKIQGIEHKYYPFVIKSFFKNT